MGSGRMAWEGQRANNDDNDDLIYNLLKRDEPNHRRERNKGHITRAEGMWQSNRRQSLREREESMQKSAKKKRLGKRPAEDPGETTQRQS